MKALSISSVVARNELKLLLRERTLYVLLTIFILMATLSTIIGWSTQHTIMKVYEAAVQELAQSGQSAPAFPVTSTPLGIVTNMIIYMVLIGSLLAITIGYFIGIHDRATGVLKVLFSRPVRMQTLFFGKVLALAYILGSILGTAFVVSIISLLVFKVFSFGALLQVALFYVVSYFYIGGFALLALALACRATSKTSALLYALFIWIIITFALPELGSALYPTSSLNPILPPTEVLNSPVLSFAHTVIYPFSISEHFKSLSGVLLGVSAEGAATTHAWLLSFVSISSWCILTSVLSFRFFTTADPTNTTLYE